MSRFLLRTLAVVCGATALFAAAVEAGAQAPAAVPPCQALSGQYVRTVAGEITGARDFREDLGNGWTFALVQAPLGWNIRILDAKGLDLTQLTPPLRFAPNPRELFGWHFRNEANTGPNEGSVNAPQLVRTFLISPAVSGTAGVRPSDGAASASPGDDEGRGELTILDYHLTNLAPGQQARMVHIKFAACLSWPGR